MQAEHMLFDDAVTASASLAELDQASGQTDS